MFTKLLLHYGYVLTPLDSMARVLASSVVATHDLDTLDQAGTVRELKRRYANIAIETGLPIEAQGKVADMAWGYIARAREQKPRATNNREFRFYT